MYKIKIVKEVEPVKWDNELIKGDYSTFFQTAEYLFSESRDERFPIFIYIVDENERIRGQLGLIIRNPINLYSSVIFRKFGKILSKLGSKGIWVSGPIIHTIDERERTEILRKIIESLDSIAREYNLILIDGYSPPQDLLIDKNYLGEFRKNNYHVEEFVTLATNLDKNIEELWNNVTKKSRGDVKRAEKRNIRVKTLEEYSEVIDYFKLGKEWAETKGIKMINLTERAQKYWNYYKTGIEKIFLAYDGDELISGLRLGCFNGIAYTHEVLNSYSRPTNLGGTLLTWWALKWAKDFGLRIYDFSGGLAPPKNSIDKKYHEQWDSLFSYKKKWGGSEFPYYHLIKIQKKRSHKILRALGRLDWSYRNYKKRRRARPIKSINDDEEIEKVFRIE
ncbi:MAG: hypothetical protein AUH25_00725 [Thaumarchaeota archaeon 13_1_40CM_38_12]|nr:MAG: hypothetical protein AUH25_00725 [Thaumarchaeota archaeon 13_1_40CM_38_12]